MANTTWAIEMQKKFIFRSKLTQRDPYRRSAGAPPQHWDVKAQCRSCQKEFSTTGNSKPEANKLLKMLIENHKCKKH